MISTLIDPVIVQFVVTKQNKKTDIKVILNS